MTTLAQMEQLEAPDAETHVNPNARMVVGGLVLTAADVLLMTVTKSGINTPMVAPAILGISMTAHGICHGIRHDID